jgi:exonuclease III
VKAARIVRTHRKPTWVGRSSSHWTQWATRPYQEDYFFASPALAGWLQRCVALNPIEWSNNSDHGPIVATFED